MEKSEIEKLVDEEVARRHLDKIVHPPQKRHWFWITLRHPLFLSLVAFAVTTGIGGWYDSILKARQAARLAEQRIVEAAQSAEKRALEDVKVLTELMYERHIRANLLKHSIVKGSREEIIERKRAFDEAYLVWHKRVFSDMANIRGMLGRNDARTPYEKAIEQSIMRDLTVIDNCVAAAFYASKQSDFSYPAPHVAINSTGKCGAGENWAKFLDKVQVSVRGCIRSVYENLIIQIKYKTEFVLAQQRTEEEWRQIDDLLLLTFSASCSGLTSK